MASASDHTRCGTTHRFRVRMVVAVLALSVHGAIIVSSSSDAQEFELGLRKVYAYPGGRNIAVPVVLSNPNSVGGWDVLIEYDHSAASVVAVEPCDSVRAVDPAADTLVWYYAPWYGNQDWRPEYFTYDFVRENWVSVRAIMDMPWPPYRNPPVAPGHEQLLFCLICDVHPMWNGRDVMFVFRTRDCSDNTLFSRDGYVQWGPDTLSAPVTTCPERPDSLRVVALVSGAGIGCRDFSCGDVNCNGIAGEIGDAILFAKYFHEVYLECEKEGCDTTWLECATPQSDINRDNYPWTISDLWLSMYHDLSCDTIDPIFSETDTMRIFDSMGSPGEPVSVTVYLHNTFPVYGYALRVVYDSTVLKPIHTSVGAEWLIGYAVYSVDDPIAPGLNSIAQLKFEVDPQATPGTVTYLNFENDTSMAQFYSSLSDFLGTHVVPQLVSGEVKIEPTYVEKDEKSIGRERSSAVQSFPNPFESETTIRYQVDEPSDVILQIYDCDGRLLRALVNCTQTEGVYSVSWDGRDASGRSVPAGIYFYRLKTACISSAGKLVAVR